MADEAVSVEVPHTWQSPIISAPLDVLPSAPPLSAPLDVLPSAPPLSAPLHVLPSATPPLSAPPDVLPLPFVKALQETAAKAVLEAARKAASYQKVLSPSEIKQIEASILSSTPSKGSVKVAVPSAAVVKASAPPAPAKPAFSFPFKLGSSREEEEEEEEEEEVRVKEPVKVNVPPSQPPRGQQRAAIPPSRVPAASAKAPVTTVTLEEAAEKSDAPLNEKPQGGFFGGFRFGGSPAASVQAVQVDEAVKAPKVGPGCSLQIHIHSKFIFGPRTCNP